MLDENMGKVVSEPGLAVDMLSADCHGLYLQSREHKVRSLQANHNSLPKKQGNVYDYL